MQNLVQSYIEYLKTERSASKYTVRNYQTDLLGGKSGGMALVPFLKLKGIENLKEVDKRILREYVAWLMENGIVKPSIARKISAIRSFYRYLLSRDLIKTAELPLSVSRRRGARSSAFSLKLDKRLPGFLTEQEAAALIEAPDASTPEGKRDRAILELFYAAGLRVSELAGLNLEQINFETREIALRGKGSKERVVLMGKPALAALTAYLSERAPAPGSAKTGAVFLNASGGRLTVRHMQRLVRKYAAGCGIGRRVHPHMLRHSFATHMLDGGADLRVVQELLGHADLSSTQIYTHVTRNQARKVYLSAHPLADRESDGLQKEG